MNTSMETILSLQACEFSLDGTPALRRMHGQVSSKLAELRSLLPVQLLREYDTRKRRFGADSVVAVENGICTGCRIAISQRTLRLSYGRIIECEHCGRLLYSSERRRAICFEICAA